MADNWIPETRNRLAQRRAKKPDTKSGQIWALWPEIKAALAAGESFRSVCDWLAPVHADCATGTDNGEDETSRLARLRPSSSSRTLPLQSTTVRQVATVGAANRHRKSLAMSASTFARRREKSTGLVS